MGLSFGALNRMKYMNNMFITKPMRAVTPMTTPTPSLSKSVKSKSLTFDGTKFEKHNVLRNVIDELEFRLRYISLEFVLSLLQVQILSHQSLMRQ